MNAHASITIVIQILRKPRSYLPALYLYSLASSIILLKLIWPCIQMQTNIPKEKSRVLFSWSRVEFVSLPLTDVMLKFYFFFKVFEYLKGVLGEWGMLKFPWLILAFDFCSYVLVLGAPALHLASLLLVWCQRLVPRVSTPGVFSGNV